MTHPNTKNMTHDEIIQKMLHDKNFRLNLVRGSHYWFMHFYFPHYVTFSTAEFQKEMFRLTESDNKLIVVVAFRGSGKSTIFTLSYPIWAILGGQQKKFVIILSQTQRQSKQLLMNLKQELERNTLLMRDLGPFQEYSDEWGGYSLVLSLYNARITAASTEQSIRGLRHIQHRPDLIVCDDIEDLQSVRTRENRDKVFGWLLGDVFPAGGQQTKTIVVGSLLHEDSVIMRLKEQIEINRMNGVFKAYPIVDAQGAILWPGKYSNQESIEAEKNKIGKETVWQREYLLRIVPDDNQVVHPEWMHYYKYPEELPSNEYLVAVYIGVDLAISQNEKSDRTAMVTLKIYCIDGRYKAYVMPHPFNERIDFPEQVSQIKNLALNSFGDSYPEIHIEKVGYQEAIGQELEHCGIPVHMIPVRGSKHDRLKQTTSAIKEGLILFPDIGVDELWQQLVGFGVEKYDDLADAFSLAVNQFINLANQPQANIQWISIPWN